MLKSTRFVLALLLLWSFPAQATTEEQTQSLEKMGQLNGIALGCRYFDQVKAIKKALVQALPKRRELGRTFEAVTDQTYREFVASKAACPSTEAFAADLEAAIQRLNQNFSPELQSPDK
ncbi:hypothetical protein [Thiolapillus sp.]